MRALEVNARLLNAQVLALVLLELRGLEKSLSYFKSHSSSLKIENIVTR